MAPAEESAPPVAPSPAASEAVSETPPCERPDCPLLTDTEYARAHDRGYSLRRAWYVGVVTAFTLIAPVVLVACGYAGDIPMKVIEGLLSICSTVVISYLCAGVLDRSQVLARIGDRFGGPRNGDAAQNGNGK